jgi:hypothetical protein
MKWLSAITVAAAMIAVGILPAYASASASAPAAASPSAGPAADAQMCNVDPDTNDCYENEPCWYAQDGNDPDCPMNDDYGSLSESNNGSNDNGSYNDEQTATNCYDFDNQRHGSWNWWSFNYGFTACISGNSVSLSAIHWSPDQHLPWYLSGVYSLDYNVTDQWTAGGGGADWAEGYIAFNFRWCSWVKCASSQNIWIEIYVDAYGVNECYTDRTFRYNCRTS